MKSKNLVIAMLLLSVVLVSLTTLISATTINIDTNNPQTKDFQVTAGSSVSIMVDNYATNKYLMAYFPTDKILMITTYGNYAGGGGSTTSKSYWVIVNSVSGSPIAEVYPIENGAPDLNNKFSDATIPLEGGDKLKFLGTMVTAAKVRLIPNGAIIEKAPEATSIKNLRTRTSSTRTDSSSSSAKKSSGSKTCPTSWTETTSADGTACCIPKSGRTTGRFLGFMFRD